jgi:hypothetical protein
MGKSKELPEMSVPRICPSEKKLYILINVYALWIVILVYAHGKHSNSGFRDRQSDGGQQ